MVICWGKGPAYVVVASDIPEVAVGFWIKRMAEAQENPSCRL
jgi:hypothetical protein